jgi:hypothetical protein
MGTAESDALRAARQRRADLHGVLVDLEHAIAAPTPGRAREWASRVQGVLERLGDGWREHVQVTEGDDGLYAEVLEIAPRLANAVHRLRDEHEDIRNAIAAGVTGLGKAPDGDTDVWALETRESMTSLLGRLARHRQRGADLVYEAYEVDVGGVG